MSFSSQPQRQAASTCARYLFEVVTSMKAACATAGVLGHGEGAVLLTEHHRFTIVVTMSMRWMLDESSSALRNSCLDCSEPRWRMCESAPAS